MWEVGSCARGAVEAVGGHPSALEGPELQTDDPGQRRTGRTYLSLLNTMNSFRTVSKHCCSCPFCQRAQRVTVSDGE